MQKTFQKWLLAFVVTAFLITFGVSFGVQTRMAKENAALLINLKIEDVKKQLTINQNNLKEIRAESDKVAISKARSFAWMIQLSPDILTQPERIIETTKSLGVDEVDVINDKGIIIACSEQDYIGYDMASKKQSAWFMEILKDPSLELAQDPQPKGFDGKIMQYAGVVRLDAPGFVQIAYHPERLENAMKIASIEKLAPGFRIGKSGHILIIQNGKIQSVAQEEWLNRPIDEYGIPAKKLESLAENSFLAQINGEENFCTFDTFAGYTIVGTLPRDEMYLSRNSSAIQIILFDLLLFSLVFILISILVQKLVINGIHRVNHSLSKITQGNLEEKVKVESSEEFLSLSNGINSTVGALKNAIAEAAARLNAELEFARAIQLASLPKLNQLMDIAKHQGTTNFDLHAVMFTAKEVGGDFYDFFFVDETHLAVIIADVSGKGIPAALFMMTIKPLIRSFAGAGLSAGEVFTKTNAHLSESSNDKMFVTAFMAILDTRTGKLTCVNAGHNPPLIKQNGVGFAFINPRPGLVLAAIDSINYKQSELQLNPGDMLFLYTDGVTEALNPELELYSEARLLNSLNQISNDATSAEVILRIRADVESYARGATQSDDITMLALEYKSPQG